jgi:hypothetical protein
MEPRREHRGDLWAAATEKEMLRPQWSRGVSTAERVTTDGQTGIEMYTP